MKEKVLIVEGQLVEAHNLRLMLLQAGYGVIGIARSVVQARDIIKQERPDFVLLDIFLKGKLTGIDLARQLGEENIAFIYLSANSSEEVLNIAKATQPYGFLVKPFRERDLLITLEIACYRHKHSMESYAVQKKEIPTDTEDLRMKTIHENERDYMITVLKKCNGKIWGAGGAAEILNIPQSTLKSKMKKLGIRKEYRG